MQVMTIFMSLSMYCPRPNFVVMFMLTNNVCVQSFNFIRASMCKLRPYLCPYHNVLPEAVCCCFTRTTLFTKKINMPMHIFI